MATQIMQASGREIAEQERPKPLQILRSQLEQRAEEFRMVLPAHIAPEKLQRTIITAAQQNPKIMEADRRSLITACMKAANDALLPDGREAALVPFKTRVKDGQGRWGDVWLVQYMPMVYGLRKKILQSGEIRDIQTAVVYRQEIEAGLFIYEEGTERMLRHKPLLDPAFDPIDADIAAAYSIATFDDGSKSFEVMRRAEINKIRECSQTGATRTKKGEPREPSGPWVDWFSEQARKTVMRRHSKTLPMSGDILDVEAADEARYAQSAVMALSTPKAEEVEPPKVLPSRMDPPHDPETGELSEEQERELDQQGFAAMEGRSDDDMGEAHVDVETGELFEGPRVDPQHRALANTIITGLRAAKGNADRIGEIMDAQANAMSDWPRELKLEIYSARDEALGRGRSNG